jgi:hypothetical protein
MFKCRGHTQTYVTGTMGKSKTVIRINSVSCCHGLARTPFSDGGDGLLIM